MWLQEMQSQHDVLSKNTRVKVISASYNPKYAYPFRIGKCSEVWKSLAQAPVELTIDSAFNEADVTNSEVVDAAQRLNANFVVPKDYPGHPEKTRESLLEFMELVENRDRFDAEPIPVIQPDHVDHYTQYKEFYDQFGTLALGGLHEFTSTEQVAIIKEFREVLGPYKRLHAFGIGMSLPMIQAIRTYSPFLNSLDMSTAEMAIRNGLIPDATMEQMSFTTPYGDKAGIVSAQFAKAVLLSVNYMLTDYVDESHIEKVYREKTPFPDIETAVEETDVRSRHDITWDIDIESSDSASVATTLGRF